MTNPSEESAKKPDPLEAAPIPKQQPLTRVQLNDDHSHHDGEGKVFYRAIVRPKQSRDDD